MAGISAGTIEAFLTLDTSGFTMGLSQARQELGTFTDGTTTAGDRMTALGGMMVGVGTTLTKSVTLPLIGIGTAAAKTAMDFEYQMSRVEAISGATGQQLEDLEQQAKDLGRTTQYSATQAAEAMEQLGSAGLDANEILKAMPGVLDLAATDNIELANAAEIAATALNGFGLEADQVGHVADVLAESAARTNATVESMGYSFSYVAPIATATGLSMEQTAAAIGILSDAGIKGTKAGTTLRGALSRIVNPTERAAEVMENLGIEFYNTDGTMKSLNEIVGVLQTQLGGLTEEERNSALTTIFGQQALTGMLALMEAGPDKINELTESYKNCDGAAKEMADTINDNTKGSWIEFKSALEGAAIAIGEVLLPHLRKGIEWLTNMVSAFANLDPKIQENIVKWGAIAAAIGPVLIVGGKFVTMIGTMVSAVSSLGGVFATLAGPAGWIVLAGTAIAGLVVAWDTMQDSLDNSTDKFKVAAENLESFEGKVRTTDYWLAEVFGEEIEIKFSADWEVVKKASEEFYNGLIADTKSYYEEKWKVDHDGCQDVEEHEKHKQDIRAKYAQLMAKQMADNSELDGRQEEIMSELTPYLTEDVGMNSLTAGNVQGEMATWIQEKIDIVKEGNQKIFEITEQSYAQYGKLTEEAEKEINEIRAGIEKERAIVTATNVADIVEAWKLEVAAEKEILDSSARNHKRFQDNIENSITKANETYGKNIDDRIEKLKKFEKETGISCQNEIQQLELTKNAVANFAEVYGRRTTENIEHGRNFAWASEEAFKSVVMDLQMGRINTEEFGLTQEEYLGLALESMILAGAGADELAAAILKIPQEKRADVIAKIEGKTDADELKKAIDRLKDKHIKVITQYENWYTNDQGKKYGYDSQGRAGYYATGTDNALSGIATVAEYGPEIIASRNSAVLATGRQLIDLAGGEKIYNARQTREILEGMTEERVDYTDALRTINTNIILLKDAIEKKNFNNIVNNTIEKIDINEVANIEEIEYQLTELMERRTYGGV